MDPKPLSDRNFGLVFAVVFFGIAAVLWLISGSYHSWLIAIALAFLLVALTWPMLLMPLNRLWMRFGHRLGLIVNTVLLGTFFYAMVTPFGIALRLFSADPMRRRTETTESYFSPVQRQAGPDTFSDMF